MEMMPVTQMNKDRASRMLLAGFGCVLIGMPTLAAADSCVSAADLEAGVRVDYNDGSAGEFRRLPDGLIEVVEAGSAAGGGDLRFLSRFGVYDVEAAALVDGAASPDQRVSYTYAGSDLREPKSGTDPWVGEVTIAFPDGATEAQTAAYVFGPRSQVDLGGCIYDVVPVRATFVRANGWEGQGFSYFPTLGIATLTSKSGSGLDDVEFGMTAMRGVTP